MTTVDVLIGDAYRENNLLPVGASPSTDEFGEALRLLNNLFSGWLGDELGENFTLTWLVPAPQRTAPVAANYPQLPYPQDLSSGQWPYPPQNSRLHVKLTAATTIYFPEQPNDGARMYWTDLGTANGTLLTINGNGKLIDGMASITLNTDTDTDPIEWFFNADAGNWQRVGELATGDESPLPRAFDDLFVTALNIRLCPRNSKNPLAATISRYDRIMKKFKNRYLQHMAVMGNAADTPPTAQSYSFGGGPANGDLMR